VLLDALRDVAECGEYGSVVAFLAAGANAPALWPELQRTVAALHETAGSAPLLLCGLVADDRRAWLEQHGCLVFREPAHAMEAVAALARAAAQGAERRGEPAVEPLPPLPRIAADANALSEHEAMQLLAEAGVPVAPHGLARDADEAVRIAERLGYPVAVKLCSREILHKSDVGGVALNLHDAGAVRAAFAQVRDATGRHAARHGGAPVRFDGVVVARMVRGWGELMVGVRRDPVFGLVALAGIGGTAVEVFRQMAFGLAPLSMPRALAMLRDSRAEALFAGHRGNPAVPLEQVAQVLVRVSQAAAAIGPRLDTLEINPFIVTAEGPVAADAVITLRP
jgi:acyl-CoA synthetase (NDP forming)